MGMKSQERHTANGTVDVEMPVETTADCTHVCVTRVRVWERAIGHIFPHNHLQR